MELNDLSDQHFGEWTVTKNHKIEKGHTKWECVCSCGTIRFIDASKLKSGLSKSCGCKHGEHITQSKTRHGQSHTRLHNIWLQMRRRCEPNYHEHKYYLDKGITVCDNWQVFENFYEWAMNNGYSENLTIDRIDNSKGYYPGNCRWADKTTQANNRDYTIKTTYKGQIINATQLSKILGISRYRVARRIKKGFNGDTIERMVCANGR